MPIKKKVKKTSKSKALALRNKNKPMKPIIQDVKNNMVKIKDIPDPKGDVALVNPNDPDVKRWSKKEQALAVATNYLQNMNNIPADTPPVIMHHDKKGRIKLTVTKVDPRGRVIIPRSCKVISAKEADESEKLASQITKKIDPALKEHIGRVTFTALVRKPLPTLKKVWKKLNPKTGNNGREPNVRLQNRLGCVFLEVDDETMEI